MNDRLFKKICTLVGVCMIIIAAFLPILQQWNIRKTEKNMKDSVQLIRSLIPESQSSILEERRDNKMAHLSLSGNDYIGILEIPRYDSSLPVCAEWGDVTKFPCRYDGSIYDKTIKIGGTSQKGQYDFYRDISVGDSVFFTDVEGCRYGYTVTDIRYERHADQTSLNSKEAALTLFIKNIYAFPQGYVVIFCNEQS